MAKRLFGKAAMPHCQFQPTSSTLTTAPADLRADDAAIQAPPKFGGGVLCEEPVSLTSSDDESSDDSMDVHLIAANYKVAKTLSRESARTSKVDASAEHGTTYTL